MHVKENSFLCEEVSKTTFSLIHFVHAKLGTWWKGGTETILCTHLYYIKEGSATVICNGEQALTMKGGNWYLLPTGTSVKYWCDDFMEEYVFHFKLCNIDHTDLLFSVPEPLTLPIKKDISQRLLKLLESNSFSHTIELQSIVFSALCDFINEFDIDLKPPELAPCVLKAISYINRNLSMRLSVTELATRSFVSKSTLEKQFRKGLGISVNEYLFDAVILKASQLLRNSEMSIRDISESLGFCDQFYFSKRFKQKFKKSPKDYRNTPTI